MDVERRISSIRRRLPDRHRRAAGHQGRPERLADHEHRRVEQSIAGRAVRDRATTTSCRGSSRLMASPMSRSPAASSARSRSRSIRTACGRTASRCRRSRRRSSARTSARRAVVSPRAPARRASGRMATIRTVDELKNIVVVGPGAATSTGTGRRRRPLPPTGRVVRLQDVAEVADTTREQTRLQRFNGSDAVGFSIVEAGRREQHPGRRQRQGGDRHRSAHAAARRQDDDHERLRRCSRAGRSTPCSSTSTWRCCSRASCSCCSCTPGATRSSCCSRSRRR